jgi:hypothetical protein
MCVFWESGSSCIIHFICGASNLETCQLLKFCKNTDVQCTLYKPLISKTLALIKYQNQPITVPELLVIAARMVSDLIHLPSSLHLSSSLQHDSEASVRDKEWEHCLIFALKCMLVQMQNISSPTLYSLHSVLSKRRPDQAEICRI